MYSTCLFCSGALGRNEAIEHFPVGRRLAFDAAKGRLWVVCKSCARWNLTPLESRWEAIEEAERAYRDTKLRASTPNVGLAKLKDGTELVRIGSPMLPEFAAWRYGDVFKRRRARNRMLLALTTGIPLVGMSFSLLEMTTGIAMAVGGSGYTMYQLGLITNSIWQSRRTRATVFTEDGERLLLTAKNASNVSVLVRPGGEGWGLRVEHRRLAETGAVLRRLGMRSRQRFYSEYTTLEGIGARRAMARILPVVNTAGENATGITAAVEVVTALETPERILSHDADGGRRSHVKLGTNTLSLMPSHLRLAMEMMLHEADERRAMEGELAELEARWKEAEEIASIADNMFLPLSVVDRVAGMRREVNEGDD